MSFCQSIMLVICLLLADENSARAKIDGEIAKIKSETGVLVQYKYNLRTFFPSNWQVEPISAKSGQLSDAEVERMLPIARKFIAKHPQNVIRRNLQNIYCLADLNFFGKQYGGTYSPTGVYISNLGALKGYSDRFLQTAMHSEFSSILYVNFQTAFPAREWKQVNATDFKYGGDAVAYLGRADIHSRDDKLLDGGFLEVYGTATIEEDFNLFSEWLFMQPARLAKLSDKHARVKAKRDLAIKFYKHVDSAYDFKDAVTVATPEAGKSEPKSPAPVQTTQKVKVSK